MSPVGIFSAAPVTVAAAAALFTAGKDRILYGFRQCHHLFRRHFTGEGHPEKLFDVRQVIASVFAEKTDGNTTVPRPARSADTVDVIL
jgi:hypothetical protein